MKNLPFTISLLSVLFFSSLIIPISAQENDFINEYLERHERSKEYLILVAEMMPEENYDLKATLESMSFAQHLMHIAWAMDWHSQSLMGGRTARDWNSDTELQVADKSKEEMIAKIEETFNKTAAFIKDFDPNRLTERLDYFGADRTKRQILLLLADHITHHRAQMLVSMRLKGIKPPKYVLYQ
ncbi:MULTISPECIES: DinB family protein [unclassified Leeuwenhoekiella]|uniref:DinB family protein n=1 Tax=unclassified Leeuwenhoekiella TaxID=2615029 RepID=UPI000C64FBA2|nr:MULTISPECIES: DinB family protein [unclassified Leeuwenhoekiella]MAW95687.1 damage-inducible protein DinB [Leeuwenhoekiella sp.]MBA80763.1 damage-inducible protein DinB [Leeuwenhoekiella sp.]|tara:strand:+ start:5187 stop:5738 length:552 start_codon:yes stop_codon:yes gene_type:complete